jgi:arylsulfatase A-like enzyme
LIRYPGTSANREENRLVSNVSIVPTIVEYTGITPGLPQDADSLIPLLNNTATEWNEGILLESGSSGAWRRFYAIRVPGWKYVEYETGDKELYHLELGVPDSDPHELYNRAKNPLYQPAIDILKPLLAAMKGTTQALTATPNGTSTEELVFPLPTEQLYFPMVSR